MGFVASPGFAGEKVNFSLDWVVSGRHTAYYVALDKGYWKKAGLDVTIRRGFGGADTVKIVAAGKANIGFADSPAALVARAKGAPVKLIAMIYGRPPYITVSKAKSGITKPKYLEGKTIGSAAGAATKSMFPSFAQIVGIDAGKIKWALMRPSAYNPSLLADKVDAVNQYIFDKVIYEMLGGKHGRFNYMMWADYGMDIYSGALQAQDGYISKNPRTVRAFVHGAVKAYGWTIKNERKGAELIAKHFPTQNKMRNYGEIQIIKELVMTDEAKKHCIGWMNAEKLARTRDVMFKAWNVKKKLDVKEAFTLKYLPCS
jgi:NitT/TauT family transport system substrate-binding protein